MEEEEEERRGDQGGICRRIKVGRARQKKARGALDGFKRESGREDVIAQWIERLEGQGEVWGACNLGRKKITDEPVLDGKKWAGRLTRACGLTAAGGLIPATRCRDTRSLGDNRR